MKHKSKNRLIKKKKERKTKKRKMKGGWNPFAMKIGIQGFGSAGQCPSKQIFENGVWKEQKCYEINGAKVYKTVQPDGAANPTKSWYHFW
jgi:hypothetical protein